MQAATIKLFLVHGSPNGLRTAELSNWSGKAIAAPRTEISELLKREELFSPGFYLLTGVDPDSGDRAIYIGEAENAIIRTCISLIRARFRTEKHSCLAKTKQRPRETYLT